MLTIWLLFEVIMNMVQCAAIAYFWTKTFPPRQQYPNTRRYAVPAWLVDATQLSIISFVPGISGVFGVPISFAIALTFACIFRRGPFSLKLFWIVAYFVLVGALTFLIRSIALRMPGVTYEFLMAKTRGRIIYVLIGNTVLLSMTLLLVRVAKRTSGEALDLSVTLISCGLIITSLLVLFLLLEVSANIPRNGLVSGALLLAAVALLVINALVLLLFNYVNRQNEKMRKIQIEQQRAELQLKSIRSSEHMQDEWRIWRHDIRSRLQALAAYSEAKDYEALDQYIRSIVSGVDKLPVPITTGNSIFDIVINQKASLARTGQIRFEADVVLPEKLNIDDDDLLVLIDNLLGNAEEACEKMPKPGERFIFIKGMMRQGYLSITVENAMRPVPKKRGVFSLTSKENNSEHGIGLHIIDNIVQTYGGFVERNARDGTYETSILMRNVARGQR